MYHLPQPTIRTFYCILIRTFLQVPKRQMKPQFISRRNLNVLSLTPQKLQWLFRTFSTHPVFISTSCIDHLNTIVYFECSFKLAYDRLILFIFIGISFPVSPRKRFAFIVTLGKYLPKLVFYWFTDSKIVYMLRLFIYKNLCMVCIMFLGAELSQVFPQWLKRQACSR